MDNNYSPSTRDNNTRQTARTTVTMGPSTLDLFILTFNCAKNLISVPVFAAHLQSALARNATGLPDLVVFSLQEVAPLSYSFIGSYFLSPYLSRFEEALNLAALQISTFSPLETPSEQEDDDGDDGDDEEELDDGEEFSLSAASTAPLMDSRRKRSAKRAGGLQGGHITRYRLVRSANVGMTAIMLFARDPSAVRDVQVAECGFGVADMGNKGAVGLRVKYAAAPKRASSAAASGAAVNATELTFVATHLAPMEWNVRRRNANWRSIMSGLTFANPKAVADGLEGLGRGLRGRLSDSAASAPRTPAEEEAEEAWLLDEAAGPGGAPHRLHMHPHHDTLRDISIFRPSSLLFVAGDLNYRTGAATPPIGAPFPRLDDPSSPDFWPAFLPRDQLALERAQGRVFQGMREAPVAFPPTYKYDVLSEREGAANEGDILRYQLELQERADGSESSTETGFLGSFGLARMLEPVPWRFAPHRWPSWCDRVLYLDVPAWTRRRLGKRPKTNATAAAFSGTNDNVKALAEVEVSAYSSLPVMRTSDHQPVFFRARVPILGAELLAPPSPSPYSSTEGSDASERSDEEEEEEELDPRLRLPIPVDVDAWERRAAARRREVLVGWSMLLWSTREGALVIATAVLLAVGGWWAYRGLW